jgi:hypothetical protein
MCTGTGRQNIGYGTEQDEEGRRRWWSGGRQQKNEPVERVFALFFSSDSEPI